MGASPPFVLRGGQVWEATLGLYWRSVVVLAVVALGIELAIARPLAWPAGVVYLLGTIVFYRWFQGFSHTSVAIHLFFSLLTTIWVLRSPFQMPIGLHGGFGVEIVFVPALALVVFALGTFSGLWFAGVGAVAASLGVPSVDLTEHGVYGLLFVMAAALGSGVHWLLNELERSRTQLFWAAYRDQLTGFLNRRSLYDAYPHYLALSVRQGQPLVLTCWDIDDLKMVNDRLGHESGDALIRRFAAALLANARAGDVLFRIGGDEFVGLHIGLDHPEDLVARVREVFPQVSEGHVTCLGKSLDEALAEADRAMYADKRRRKRAARFSRVE